MDTQVKQNGLMRGSEFTTGQVGLIFLYIEYLYMGIVASDHVSECADEVAGYIYVFSAIAGTGGGKKDKRSF